MTDDIGKSVRCCRYRGCSITNFCYRTDVEFLCREALYSSGESSVYEYEYERLLYRIAESPSDALGFSYYHKVAAGLIETDVDSAFVNHKDGELNGKDVEGNSPLHWAALKANVPALKALLRARADVDTTDNMGSIPLHCTSRSGNQRCMELLLMAGSSVFVGNTNGWQALHYAAAYQDNREMLDTLLIAGANIHGRNHYGNSALQLASGADNLYSIITLLAAGADIDNEDTDGDTALSDAIHYGRTRIAKVLLDHGAGIQHRNRYGRTILHQLATYGTIDMIALFMSRQLGCLNVDEEDDKGLTAWKTMQHRPALPEGFQEAFEALLARCKEQGVAGSSLNPVEVGG